MRSLLLVAPLIALGCSSTISTPPATPALTQKDVDAIVEKRVKEELARRDADPRQAIEDAEKRLAAAKPPEPKVWTFDEAMREAKRQIADLKLENFDELSKRLTPLEAVKVAQVLVYTPEQYAGMPESFKTHIASTLRSAGFTNALLQLSASGGLSHQGFHISAKAVWDKVPTFRNPASIIRAATLVGNDSEGLILFATNYFPRNVTPNPIPETYRDFWEAFSGTTWDKLK